MSDPRTRIADSDRERAMADLAGHYADGRLDHEEYDERLDAIWTARTRADLAVLFSDLPKQAVPYPQPAARSARRPYGPRRRFPLLPVVVVLIALSALTHAPFWLLVFPLMFVRSRRRQAYGSTHGFASGQTVHTGHTGYTGHTDYRRR